MNFVIYEDGADAPVSRCLAENSDEHVKIVFTRGNWNISNYVLSLTKDDFAIAFLDMPPNNGSMCEIFDLILEETKDCECEFILIPVVCTEYYVLKCFVSEDCFKNVLYVDLYRMLVQRFVWQDALPYIIKAGIVEDGKPKSIEKIYKAILNNVKYECLRNKSGKGAFYVKECSSCQDISAAEPWRMCSLDKRFWPLQKRAVQLYVSFPAYCENKLTEKYQDSLMIRARETTLDQLALKARLDYMNMCQNMGVESVFGEEDDNEKGFVVDTKITKIGVF